MLFTAQPQPNRSARRRARSASVRGLGTGINPSAMLAIRPTLRLNIPAQVIADLDPLVVAARRAAATMPDAQFYGWESLLPMPVHPAPVDLMQPGACGGGGCNASFSNSQFWDMHATCSAEVYTGVLFQWSRYEAARARLRNLMANAPQSWVRDMYNQDGADAQGRSTALPTLRAPLLAAQWADWTLEVMRTIAVARWATNVQWCNGERTPDFYLGLRNGPRMIKATENFDSPSERAATLAELGTVASARGRMPRTIDVASTDVAWGTFPPDEAWPQFGGYHPQGFFRGTSERGASKSRWTFGPDTSNKEGLTPGTVPGWYPDLNAGISEVHPYGTSDALRAPSRQVFGNGFRDDFDPYRPAGDVDHIGYTPTVLQFATALRLRRGQQSGVSAAPNIPTRQSDWDPIYATSLTRSEGVLWPSAVVPPSGGIRDVLIALYTDARTAGSEAAEGPRAFGLNVINIGGRSMFSPGPLRQIWWVMAHANDVIDTSLGAVVSTAFQNMLTAMNQLPPGARTQVPSEVIAMARGMTQQNLDMAFAAVQSVAGLISTIAAGAATVPIVGWIAAVVLLIVAALVELAAGLTQAAQSLGIVRGENPPVLPQIVLRSAGALEDPSDPCWLVTPQAPGSGGPASFVPKATAVQEVAATTDDPTQWYTHVRDAIAIPGLPPRRHLPDFVPVTAPPLPWGMLLGGAAVALTLALVLRKARR